MTYKIALDAGHGLYTKGKQTPTGIKEWTLNDDVRDLVVEHLEDYDVAFIFPDKNEGKTDESLASRKAYYISKGADVMVSIHHNAFTSKWNKATGVEVWTDKNNTADDMRLAKCIYKRLPKYTGLKARGIKKENWAVINQNKIPAVLIEGGFMDSTIDYKVLTSDAGKDAYAKAVAEGLVEFLGLKKKTTKTTTKKPVKKTEKKPTTTQSAKYYKKCSSKETSLVDGLNSIGVSTAFSVRKKIANANGIKGYAGTASQNTKLLLLLKSGKLKRI
jgi:N-acetylmuramoyl-L-alanine amidase